MAETRSPGRGAGAGGPRRALRYWVHDPAAGLVSIAGAAALRAAGIDTCSNIGARTGRWFHHQMGRYDVPAADAQARANWVRLRPKRASPEEVDVAIGKMWVNIGRTLAEFAVVDRFWDAGRITVEGRENLDAAAGSGRPIILMPMHLGNWEVLGPTLVKLGHRVFAVYQPPANRFDHWLVLRARRRFGVDMLPPGRAGVRPALRVLEARQGIVSIFPDEYVEGQVHGPFFGRPPTTRANLGVIARFAARTDALVLPAHVTREKGARFSARFHPPVDLLEGGAQPDLEASVRRLNGVIEPIIRANLAQWFWLPQLRLEDAGAA